MWNLTRLQVANFHRQFKRWDIIGSHNPLRAAAASVLNTESRDRKATVRSGDPGDIHWTFSCHGDGGAVGGLGYWDKKEQTLSRADFCGSDLKHTESNKNWQQSSQHPISCEDGTSSQGEKKGRERTSQWNGMPWMNVYLLPGLLATKLERAGESKRERNEG